MAENLYKVLEGKAIPRNYFNLKERVDGTIKAGFLIPLWCTLMLPNDLFKLSNQVVIRQMPTINPSFSNHTFTVRYFVVAVRNIHKDIYRWLSGWKEYSKKTPYTGKLPLWKPSSLEITKPGELWDWLGFPIDCIPDDNSLPQDFYRLAYNYIWDFYFRNQTIQDSILDDGDPSKSTNEKLLHINWTRDFFTTCLPFQQLGEAIGVPIDGEIKGVTEFSEMPWELKSINMSPIHGGDSSEYRMQLYSVGTGELPLNQWGMQSIYTNTNANPFQWQRTAPDGDVITSYGHASLEVNNQLKNYLSNNYIRAEQIGSMLITELRFAMALQRNAEMLAQGGIRDDEVLKMYYGTAPTDETLGKPYYLGSSKTNILTSEVLQTAPTNNPKENALGDMGGHGLGASIGGQITYHAKELCIIMALGYIKPDTTYAQGMPRIKSFKDKYAVAIPIFQHLSEQPIYKREILCASTEKCKSDYTSAGKDETAEKYNDTIFGYRPIYDHFRDSWNRIAGLFHREHFWKDADNMEEKPTNNLSNWTETRFFSTKDGERPALNDDFLKCQIDNRNYVFKTDNKYGDQFLISYTQEVHAWRPLTLLGTPAGLI